MDHSVLAPSAASMWVMCPGWVVMSQSFPELTDTEHSRTGTAAHEVAAKFIDSYARGGAYNPQIGDITSNNVVIDEEMLDAAEYFAGKCREIMLRTGVFGGESFGLERRLTMSSINEHVFGTPDFFIVDLKNNTVYISDFKYGHDPIEVFENWQLIAYAAGVVDHLLRFTPFVLDRQHGMKFVLNINQPRSFHADGPLRTWTTTLGNLLPYFQRMKDAAALAMSGLGETQSGPHCRYCPARHGCQSAISASVRLYEVASQALPLYMSDEATATQLAIVTRAVKQLEAIKDALEQQVENMVRSGKHVPGYGVTQTVGRQTWSKPIDEVFLLGDMLQIDLRKPTAVTPKQAIKLGIDEAVIKEYTHKPVTGLKVVPDDGSKARHIFGDNNHGK